MRRLNIEAINHLDLDLKDLAEWVLRMRVLQFEEDLVFFVNILDARCNSEPDAVLCNSLIDEFNPIWEVRTAS